MGLFKKENKENAQNIETVDLNKKDEVEILDLENETPKVENTLEKRKENRIMFTILGVLLVFALLLPTISGIFKRTSMFSYNNEQKEIEENKTVDGMLEIDKEEGFITAKKIKFYNIRKKKDNQISIVYLPQTEVKNVNDYNLYIELYNSNKTLIYREKFVSEDTLERKVQKTYRLDLNETIYKEATYGKVLIIKDEEWETKSNSSLVCKKNFTDEEVYDLTYEVTYNFGNKGLLNYNVKRSVTVNLTEEEMLEGDETTEEKIAKRDKYKKMFTAEADEITKTNITDLFYDDKTIEYKVNLLDFEKNKSSYILLYDKSAILRQIKLTEVSNGWSCE